MELILKCIIAAIFGLAVFAKLSGKTKSTFDNAGLSPLFMYGIALVEVILTIGLFTSYDLYAIIALLGILTVAALTLYSQKAVFKKYLMAIVSVVLLLVLYYNEFN